MSMDGGIDGWAFFFLKELQLVTCWIYLFFLLKLQVPRKKTHEFRR